MAFGRGAKLEVVVAGDTRQLDRALTRSEARLKKFGKNVGTVGGGSGGLGSAGGILAIGTRSNAALAGAAALALGLRSMTRAAQEAEVVAGQTGVAVAGAGLSWATHAARVEDAATRISRASAFDDEAVLQSFQVFVRGQRDIEKSLELSALAADVARGRYTDLESATQLVNKAAMGQVGALRRAGIQIDANATSTQALAILQQRYAGAAKQYAESSAGAADRLTVAWENFAEELGGVVAPGLGTVATGMAKVLEQSEGFLGSIKRWSPYFRNAAESAERMAAAAAAAEGMVAPGEGHLGGTGMARPRGTTASPVLLKQIPNRLRSAELDARLSGNTAALKGVLAQEAQVLQGALKQKGLKPGEVVDLKQALLGVADEITSIDEGIIAGAREKTEAARAAKDAQKAAHQKAVDALKAQAQAFRDQADDIKSAVLDTFDTKQSKVNNARALADARESLRVARMIGAPEGIKLANRGVQDARFALERQRIEGMAFKVGAGPPGPVSALTAGGITININGAQNPETIASQVIAAINKRSKQTAGQSRGRTSGGPMRN